MAGGSPISTWWGSTSHRSRAKSIERVEITRGNSGAVLYGDGAMGGVINIVTKTGVALPTRARLDTTVGSFNYREGNASFTGSKGPWSASIYSNAVNSNGYREHNFYRQLNGVADFRYTVPDASAYLNLSADNSWLDLPGGRLVDPSINVNLLVTDRRGATTPFDWAGKKGKNATLGFTHMIAPWAELIVDGGVRHKAEAAEFHGFVSPGSSDPVRAVDTQLTTASFTPRLRVDAAIGEVQIKGLGGFDYYRAVYGSDRPLFLGAAPIHRYDLAQTSLAAYWMQTVTFFANTDIGVGGRIQGFRLSARDRFDASAPGGSFCFPGFGCFPNGAEQLPLDTSENNRAYHLGIEHRFNRYFAVFARMAQSFRVPNVDERVGTASDCRADDVRSEDAEIARLRSWRARARSDGSRCRPASTTCISSTRSTSGSCRSSSRATSTCRRRDATAARRLPPGRRPTSS